MSARRDAGAVRLGPVSVFVLVMGVCLAVLAVLCLATGQAQRATAERQAATLEATYANEAAANAVLAQVEGSLAESRAAVTAAEMAQLLFSTLHTTGAATTVDRIVDAFPANQQRQIRIQLAMVLQAVVSQQLVPTVDGGVAPAWEIMVANPAIRNLIREEKTHQMDSVIAAGGAQGMRTMDQSLFDLVKEGRVTRETALQFSNHTEALAKHLDAASL